MIDVIIPVYKGGRETRRCIDSVLGSVQHEPFDVVVVDDASPDAEIVTYVKDLAAAKRITLVRNETNAGFVRSVNRGMAMHPDRDVVLLNSDTGVANDWLDRLRKSAESGHDVGTATPFSNNATICTYPFPGWAGGMPGTLDLAALDRLFATANAGRTVELPTAVGSCMYIRRPCLQDVGLFDAERFGRGYGEENDFCLRAAKAGWRHVLAGDVFIFHEGAVSFSDERSTRANAAEEALLEVHPDYLRRVRDFLLRDPASALRQAVDIARAALGAHEATSVLTEQAAHRAQVSARLAEVEALADERSASIAKLDAALAHAEAVVAERDTAIRERNEEIAKLRGGLAHAEALAFERAAELERIHRSWMWRTVAFLLRKS
jgi:GT2 family glycosyltransferase